MKIRGLIDYPESIIPKINFYKQIDFDLLLASNRNIYLLRRSEKPFEQTFQSFGKGHMLRLNAISNERLPKLSLNLLGAFFKREHLKYVVSHKKPGGDKWRDYKKISFKDYFKDYEVTDVGCEIYLHANNINGKTFPFSFPFSKENARVVRDFEKAIGEGMIKQVTDPIDPTNIYYLVSGVIKLVHDPLVLNYWHVEMISENFNGKEVKSASPAWTQPFFDSMMKNLIRVNAYPTREEIGTINQNIYLNVL
ncbi:hypothetical protein [Flavobacterium branchiicola]|uniref:hypothetical protein n=1 Tax=Flavobacterium branchiicola TaxID=1114875 RepID=UPI0036D29B49